MAADGELRALTASMENYLETIYQILASRRAVRAKDIAKQVGVSMSSVTHALGALAKQGMVNYAPYDVITLTPEGQAAAEDVVRRHEALRDFFVKVLSIDAELADQGACSMEHSVPREIVDRLIEFVRFARRCPRGGAEWVDGSGYHCYHAQVPEICEACQEAARTGTTGRQPEDGKGESATEGEPTTMTLCELEPGDRAKVVAVKSSGQIKKRLIEMGMTPGTVVQFTRLAPLGDPVDVKLKGYHLSLRKSEAAGIVVEVVR